MHRRQHEEKPGPSRGRALSLAFFLGLAVVHTWPLATSPGALTRHDNADTYLNQWILAWVAHVLPSDPLSLFEANIFHPSPHALAFSEHLIVQGVMGAPLAWLGALPVLAFNLVLLAGLALTGWTTSLAVRRWTGDWAAALLAGSIAAFNTHTLSRMSHVQAMHVEFLPLALVALDRLIREPRVGHAVRLAGWSTLQMLCSGYLLVFTALMLTAGVAARPIETLGDGRWRLTPPLLAIAAALTVAACLPFLMPYAAVDGDLRLVRSLDEVAHYSASLQDYVTTVANWHHRWWSHRYVFNSTRHWKPLVNGYSGLTPPGYLRYADMLQTFPDEASLALLRDLGVTHVVVHLDRAPEMADRLAGVRGLEQQVAGRDLRVYRLR